MIVMRAEIEERNPVMEMLVGQPHLSNMPCRTFGRLALSFRKCHRHQWFDLGQHRDPQLTSVHFAEVDAPALRGTFGPLGSIKDSFEFGRRDYV